MIQMGSVFFVNFLGHWLTPTATVVWGVVLMLVCAKLQNYKKESRKNSMLIMLEFLLKWNIFFIIFMAWSALFDLFIWFEMCLAQFSLLSKITPSTFMLLLPSIIVTLTVNSNLFCMILWKRHISVLIDLPWKLIFSASL